MSAFLTQLPNVAGMLGGAAIAGNEQRETYDRAAGGVCTLAAGLQMGGSMLAPGISATGVFGGTAASAVPGAVAEIGATCGTASGVGAAMLPAAALLTAGVTGWTIGRGLDILSGYGAEKLGFSGTTASDWLSGTEHTVGERGGAKAFGDMSEAELTLSAFFNEGMNDEKRADVLERRKEDVVELFGGLF